MDCLVPGKHLRALGLKPRGTRDYELADGSEVTLDVTVAEVEFMEETVGATVIFGPDDAEPILGVTALESAGRPAVPATRAAAGGAPEGQGEAATSSSVPAEPPKRAPSLANLAGRSALAVFAGQPH